MILSVAPEKEEAQADEQREVEMRKRSDQRLMCVLVSELCASPWLPKRFVRPAGLSTLRVHGIIHSLKINLLPPLK